jgi:hypothetical protein
LGSTLYIANSDPQALDIYVLEGKAVVQTADSVQLVPAGTFTTVPLTADGKSPDGDLTPAQPYELDVLGNLPLAGLANAIEVATPVPSENIEAVVAETFVINGVLAGQYRYENTGNCSVPSQGDRAYTNSGTVRIQPEETAIVIVAINSTAQTVYTVGADGRYYYEIAGSTPSGFMADGTQVFSTGKTTFVMTIISSTQLSLQSDGQSELPLYADGYATGAFETQVCSGNGTYVWQSF